MDIDNTDEGNNKNKTKRNEGINIDIGNIDFHLLYLKVFLLLKLQMN